MSMFVSFVAVPKSMDITEFDAIDRHLNVEVDGMIDFKPEVVQLGLFVDGKWNKDEFLDLYRGQHLGCLGDIIPPESYYRVLTPEMIAEIEASMPSAKRYDNAKKRATRDAGSHPLARIMAASVENETVENFVISFAVSARQALADYGSMHQIVVVVM